jgi:hypothetical protein
MSKESTPQKANEMHVLAAVTSTGGTLDEVASRCWSLSPVVYRSTLLALIGKGAVVPEGRGARTRLTRNLGRWHR